VPPISIYHYDKSNRTVNTVTHCLSFCLFRRHSGVVLQAGSGCLTLLEILEIRKVSWKFSGLVCVFVINISYNSCISECTSTKCLMVNQHQLILRLIISVSVS